MATATTTRAQKRPAAKKAANARKAAPARTEEAAPATNGDQPKPATSAPDLAAAYWAAIDDRDQATGQIPAVPLDTVKVAFRAADSRKRANLVKALTLEASGRVVNDAGEVDTGLALAIKALTSALTEVRAEVIASEKPAHDPVPHVAAVVAALDAYRAELVDRLTTEQREKLSEVTVSEEDATAAAESLGKALERIRERALNGRSGYTGPRKPAAATAAAVRQAVHEADGPLTFTQLAKATGLEGSTVYSRWKANNTEGVDAITDDQGHRVFVKAS